LEDDTHSRLSKARRSAHASTLGAISEAYPIEGPRGGQSADEARNRVSVGFAKRHEDDLTPAMVMSAPVKSINRRMCAYRLPEAECKHLRRSSPILRTRMGSG